MLFYICAVALFIFNPISFFLLVCKVIKIKAFMFIRNCSNGLSFGEFNSSLRHRHIIECFFPTIWRWVLKWVKINDFCVGLNWRRHFQTPHQCTNQVWNKPAKQTGRHPSQIYCIRFANLSSTGGPACQVLSKIILSLIQLKPTASIRSYFTIFIFD